MNLIWLIGAFDAIIIAGLGAVGAGLLILGKDYGVFYDRVIPACATLVGTSFAAGIVMSLTEWLSG